MLFEDKPGETVRKDSKNENDPQRSARPKKI
jgi:hypothetical protein